MTVAVTVVCVCFNCFCVGEEKQVCLNGAGEEGERERERESGEAVIHIS